MIINKRLYQYPARFGLITGLKLFFKIRASRSRGTICFRLPQLKHVITLRRQSSDFLVFEEIFIDEIYKRGLKAEAAYIIDAGANIGLAALYFHRKFPEAKIICIEPVAENYQLLELNTAAYDNIICYHNGLWNKKVQLNITNTTEGDWAFMVEETEDAGDINAIAVNDILQDHPTSKIDILKMDIEGSEKEVFQKNTEWISLCATMIVEMHENKRPGATATAMGALQGFEFTNQSANYYFRNPVFSEL